MDKFEILQYANEIYPLKSYIRYNNSPKICNESVIEHSGFVTLIVLYLSKYFKFNIKKALIMAISHDLPEIDITDIPHNTKEKFPDLKKALRKAELQTLEKRFGRYLKKLNIEFENAKTIEAKIVQLADIISVIQYSYNEVKLGNSGYMSEVYERAQNRFNEIWNQIEEKCIIK